MEYLLGGRGTVALLTEDKLQVLVSSTEEALIPDYVDEVYTGAIWRKREFMNKLSDLLKTVKSKKLLLDNAPPLLRSHAIGLLSSHEKLIMNIGNMYDIEFDNAHNLVEELRTVKTVKEQEIIKKSVRKTEEILEDVVGSLNGEKTEKDVLGEIYKETYSYAFPSFPPIVAFGSHTASPHHIPENEKLKGNNIFLIDM
nr:M24 family metallopeptidase [Candidatus Thorarchaeota archaeon]